jgi:hypothetical protein
MKYKSAIRSQLHHRGTSRQYMQLSGVDEPKAITVHYSEVQGV